jgi:hypothetical protein
VKNGKAIRALLVCTLERLSIEELTRETTMVVTATARPSDQRRKALRDEITLPIVSNFFPIERYYEAAEKVYVEFQLTSSALQSTQSSDSQVETIWDENYNTVLDLCFVYGKRYCLFCINAIPTHNYYGTPKYKALHSMHMVQLSKVVSTLEDAANQMDIQEELRARLLRQQQEELDRQAQTRLEQWQQQLQQQKQSNNTNPTAVDVQQSAMDKLKLLQQSSHPTSTLTSSSTRYHFVDDSGDSDTDSVPNHSLSLNGITPLLPPPQPSSVPTPPSYDAIVKTSRFHPSSTAASYVRPPPTEERIEQPLPRKDQTPKVTSIRQLQIHYKNMYLKYQQCGKISVYPIDTYQGRVSESTNGCTVISALIAARHLNDSTRGTFISNDLIKYVIDTQCGPILRTIRRKLGLGGHALIIPSDVHDHLVDAKILHQDYFAGASGGNIMDQQHYGEFLKLLSDTDYGSSTTKTSNGKAGATLFFHEHVISIVKFTDATTNRIYFDLIDSMPGILENGKSMATRTRCCDAGSLEVLLLWYASRKFSESNCTYIDRNAWDDSMADLDPRVFQGFVWST